jgi:hypothetical protein
MSILRGRDNKRQRRASESINVTNNPPICSVEKLLARNDMTFVIVCQQYDVHGDFNAHTCHASQTIIGYEIIVSAIDTSIWKKGVAER